MSGLDTMTVRMSRPGRCTVKVRSDAVSGGRHRRMVHRLVGHEHPDLQLRTVRVVPRQERLAHRLEHEMDVPGLAVGVGPQARIYLCRRIAHLGRGERDSPRDPRERRTEGGGLFRIEVGQVDHVPQGLDDDGAHAEWTDAVLHRPWTDRRDASTRNSVRVPDQVTGKALFAIGTRLAHGRVHTRDGRWPRRARACANVT